MFNFEKLEAGRGIGLAIPILKRVAGKRLLCRQLTGTTDAPPRVGSGCAEDRHHPLSYKSFCVHQAGSFDGGELVTKCSSTWRVTGTTSSMFS
jgi:hypothetical protein